MLKAFRSNYLFVPAFFPRLQRRFKQSFQKIGGGGKNIGAPDARTLRATP